MSSAASSVLFDFLERAKSTNERVTYFGEAMPQRWKTSTIFAEGETVGADDGEVPFADEFDSASEDFCVGALDDGVGLVFIDSERRLQPVFANDGKGFFESCKTRGDGRNTSAKTE